MKQYTLKNPDVFKPKKVEPDLQSVILQDLNDNIVEFCDSAIEDVMRKVKNGELLCCRCGKPATHGILTDEVVIEGWNASIQFRIICTECQELSDAYIPI